MKDIRVAEQALKIWPDVNKYVKTVKNERKAPASASFVSVASACDDNLIEAKLEFFCCCGKTAARIFVEVSNQSSNDSFLDFIFEKFVVGYHESFSTKRSCKKS